MNERHLYEACPLCEAGDIGFLRSGDCSQHQLYQPQLSPQIRWMRCAACGHVFTEGFFTDEALAVVFSAVQDIQRVGANLEGQRLVFSRIVEKTGQFLDSQSGRWLDIGFGNAGLIFAADEFGYDTVGLDLRQDNVGVLNKLGFKAYRQDVLEFTHEDAFDVISLADVLEHMPYPVKVLKHVKTLLKKGGLLFLSMPNSDAFIWRALDMQNANPYWGELEHYHNFGRKRLFALLQACGFAPLHYDVSERYRACMQVIARPNDAVTR